MEIPRGLALLLLMIHLTREEVEEDVEEEEEESAAEAQLPPGECYVLSKENMEFVLLQQCNVNTTS